ncbi:hypothetical protein [Paenibacillus sp.]|uniref:hypothetical protein n=1 Tax=Paenibacillus sp. TaxID=58172 RepID=UPI0028261472|nr:hypothetical protein [Paenibacillus sp.]MDR0267469.1 hypothetical protein [Paenibacillus sp.]
MGIKHVPIQFFLNNIGLTDENSRGQGAFTLGKASYPMEHAPVDGSILTCKDTSFLFPIKTAEGCDNMTMENQLIPFKLGNYVAIDFLGASNNGSFYEQVTLLYKGKNVYQFFVKLSDVIKSPEFGEQIALTFPFLRYGELDATQYQPNLYHYHQAIPSGLLFDEIKMGDNPFIHIFAISLREE